MELRKNNIQFNYLTEKNILKIVKIIKKFLFIKKYL